MADISKWDGKIRPTIGGSLAVYIRMLAGTGLYGLNEAEVVRTLVRDGIQRAIKHGFIDVETFRRKTNAVSGVRE